MTSEMMGQIAAQDVHNALKENLEVIASRLSMVCDDEKIMAAVLAGMQISAEISVQIIIKTLEQAGVIDLPPDGAPVLWIHEEN